MVTSPHVHSPPTHSQWVAGPGRTAQGRAVGPGRAPSPGRPTPTREAPPPPPGALVPPPQRAKRAHKSRPARRGASNIKPGKGTEGPGHSPKSYIGGAEDNPQHAPRGTRGQGGAEGEKREPAPAPIPRSAASASQTRPGHCTCQGSSSTQCYTQALRLGSLLASPWGPHWRQASSTARQRRQPG